MSSAARCDVDGSGVRIPVRIRSLAPYLLGLAVVLAYLPSLGGGFLTWDDPWLIRDNPVLRSASPDALPRIWTDFSRETRLELGAEWLPVRDTELWLEARFFGLDPRLLRATGLALYLAAVLCFRSAFHRSTRSFAWAEVSAWVFALHPLHVESVAWLSGRKDVLGLLFVGAALMVHAGQSARRVWLVPLCLGLAHLSKSMTISALGLCLALDLLSRRRLDGRLYSLGAAVAFGALLAHTVVGDRVGMTVAPAGGSRLVQALSMAPVVVRYLTSVLWPPALSLVQDVPIRTSLGVTGAFGLALPLVWLGAGALRARLGKPLWLSAWLLFFVPLLPVSQVVFPLQNQMADRYLFLSLLGPALLAGALFERVREPSFALAPLTLFALGATTAERAYLFASSSRAFADATAKTVLSPIAPYQLASEKEAAGDPVGAMRSYELALARSAGSDEVGRRATNNLAKLRVDSGDLAGARAVLTAGRLRYPDDPKLLANLVRVLARLGQTEQARRVYDELVRRFPEEARSAAAGQRP
ncbi:MAG: tetratricopeptide repeat protein [Myxococcales bacterium]|nr:tetratricopeptide repeat protein [Myxococcales bacterium]